VNSAFMRNLILTVTGMLAINAAGLILHGEAKPIVELALAMFFLAAIALNAALAHRSAGVGKPPKGDNGE
jgi:hypothetical protein